MPQDPTGRALQLLSLLQSHRLWSGAELAERLEVTERTVRRDVDRLRDLGYPVEATTGTEGGYRLATGAQMPPLLLDDDEAVAVAVGLRSAAGAAIDGMEESSLRLHHHDEQPRASNRAIKAPQVHGADAVGNPSRNRRRGHDRTRHRDGRAHAIRCVPTPH